MGTTKDDIVRESASGAVDRRKRWLLLLLTGIFTLLLVVTAIAAAIAIRDYKSSAQDGTDLAREVQIACADPEQAAELGPVCKSADNVVADAPASVKGDKGDPGAQGEQGAQGPPPSSAQVAQAVALYCANGACDGKDGANATQAQVAQAVALFCNARGDCRGPEGVAGQEGQDGTQGPQGDTGPPPSAAQVQAAVASYCSTRNDCAGPKGEPGPAGAEGPQGPAGVVNVVDNCDPAPEGQVVANVDASYDADAKTVVLSCTYKPDQTGLIPGNGG